MILLSMNPQWRKLSSPKSKIASFSVRRVLNLHNIIKRMCLEKMKVQVKHVPYLDIKQTKREKRKKEKTG